MNEVQSEMLNNTLRNRFARSKTDIASAQMTIVQPQIVVARCEMNKVEPEMAVETLQNRFAEFKTAIVLLKETTASPQLYQYLRLCG